MKILPKNDLYFEIPNAQNSFWAGYIAADGCVSDKGTVSINLNRRDRVILEKIKSDLSIENSICDRITKTSVNGYSYETQISLLNFTSKKICSDLNKWWNIVPRKSLIYNPPKITDDLFTKSFLAGYIMGDGYIGLRKNNNTNGYKRFELEIAGTMNMCLWIKNIFNSLVPEQKILKNISKVNKIYKYRSFGERAYLICQSLYNLDGIFYLPRKWDKLLEYKLKN